MPLVELNCISYIPFSSPTHFSSPLPAFLSLFLVDLSFQCSIFLRSLLSPPVNLPIFSLFILSIHRRYFPLFMFFSLFSPLILLSLLFAPVYLSSSPFVSFPLPLLSLPCGHFSSCSYCFIQSLLFSSRYLSSYAILASL